MMSLYRCGVSQVLVGGDRGRTTILVDSSLLKQGAAAPMILVSREWWCRLSTEIMSAVMRGDSPLFPPEQGRHCQCKTSVERRS